MKYFEQDFIKFFTELEENNHKDWFDINRKRYLKNVKAPFETLIGELIVAFGQTVKGIHIETKDAMLRINRDVRFSKDKTPYLTHVSAIISEVGRKDKGVPGLYICCNHKEITLYGGVYMTSKERLLSIRNAIADNPKKFNRLINANDFVEKFGGIEGDKNKRLDAKFKSLEPICPEIANKQFLYSASLPSSFLLEDGLSDVILEYWIAALPLRNFLAEAIATADQE